ncbi:hypothetical protein Mal4_02150 [Maioricimonas rarisocia]|uniref:DUF2262 domain-containing protein n=1 Tax=Maioricimonas rarisocia TaxID=2528026 RepID=A0A517Z0F0_9PLAN|nr:hypothetical protein [Maioricimonas rarisocia]QDU35933.1 hypothetical protein Mal4_02150 [Maioricimonas rarisocia]
MSARFEVLLNGERICVAGIDGEGVLSVGLDYVKRQDEDPELNLHVGGLGQYRSDDPRSQHVTWPTPESIGVGDEVTIRLIPPGEFDAPVGMTDHPASALDDPVFGRLEYSVDAWNGVAAISCPPFTSTHVHLRAGEEGPTDDQRSLFLEFTTRFEELWPSLAEALVRCHPDIRDQGALLQRLRSNLAIQMYGEPQTLEIVFSFTGDDGLACFVTLRDWEIAEISLAR